MLFEPTSAPNQSGEAASVTTGPKSSHQGSVPAPAPAAGTAASGAAGAAGAGAAAAAAPSGGGADDEAAAGGDRGGAKTATPQPAGLSLPARLTGQEPST